MNIITYFYSCCYQKYSILKDFDIDAYLDAFNKSL